MYDILISYKGFGCKTHHPRPTTHCPPPTTTNPGIHISSRQVVRDDYKELRTSIKNHKLVRWTSKFQGANFSLISTSQLVILYCSEQKINIL